VHKPRNRLLRGYEPDPVPPAHRVRQSATTPPAEGKAVTASPRDGWGTADEGPRGQQSAQAQATATCPTGLLNPDA